MIPEMSETYRLAERQRALKAAQIHEQSPWQQMTEGGEIYEGGTSRLTKTGEWRTQTPVFLEEKCAQCLLCVPFCPDSSIPVVDGKRLDFDFDHCKGCGICANVCPFHAIQFGPVPSDQTAGTAQSAQSAGTKGE